MRWADSCNHISFSQRCHNGGYHSHHSMLRRLGDKSIYSWSHVDRRPDSLRSAQVSVIPVCVTCIGEESRASVGCMGRSCRSLLPDGADCFGSGWQCAYLNVLPSWLFLCLPGHLWPLCTLRLAGQEMEVPSFRMPWVAFPALINFFMNFLLTEESKWLFDWVTLMAVTG